MIQQYNVFYLLKMSLSKVMNEICSAIL